MTLSLAGGIEAHHAGCDLRIIRPCVGQTGRSQREVVLSVSVACCAFSNQFSDASAGAFIVAIMPHQVQPVPETLLAAGTQLMGGSASLLTVFC